MRTGKISHSGGPAMVVTVTMSLTDIARDAAASPHISEYLEQRGLKSAATLALLAKDEEGLDRTLIQPLLQGWTKADGSQLTIPESDKPIARAVLLHMWLLARQQWTASQNAMQPTSTAPQTTAPASASTASEDKVPKTLPPGKWGAMVKEYQSKQIDGEDRTFPTHEVLGAEAVLARVVHEVEISKNFTPVLLGEIIAARTFQSTGEPNPLAKREKAPQRLTLMGEQLTTAPEEPWTPRSVLAIMDGLNSIRCRPNKTDQLAQFYLSTSWKLALEMRSGKTFAETSSTLMKDFDSFTECMNREPTQIKKANNNQTKVVPGKAFTALPEKVILLSCFDGIGSAAHIVQELTQGISLHVAWETDPECIAVTNRHFPETQHRGDFMSDDPKSVAKLIIDHDPQGLKLVLFVSAPPCPDFSRIKDEPPGSSGTEGQKFTAYCGFVNQVEMQIPHKRVGHLTENVIMEKGEADFFSSRLDCNAVASDAADFGLINRPRLWWTRVDWSKIRVSPITGRQLRWSKTQKFHRIHYDGPMQEATDLDLGDLQLYHKVASHESRMPCFTTPAPTEAGRPPPKKLKGKLHPEQKARWLNDQRTFAPWQYAEEALLHGADGAMQVPPPSAKEQLHQLPADYTWASGVSDRARHRMVANGWHIGSAKFMMMLVIQMALLTATAEPQPPPCRTALQQMLSIVGCMKPSIGPGHWSREPVCVPRATTMWEHWELSKSSQHPLLCQPQVEPGLRQCLEVQEMIGGSLPRMRAEIIAEVNQMAEERMASTRAWWTTLPPHIAQVYYDQEHEQISQIPLLLELLEMTGMPGLQHLSEDLQKGFVVLGKLHPGAGWLPRADQKYEHPVTAEALKQNNRHYATARLRSQRVDPEWKTMQEELRSELRKGRMSGPYSAPDWWPTQAVSIDDRPLTPLENQDICISFCFSVRQADKVRRCEDFRRSGHNSTVVAHDVPHHHDIKVFTDLALAASSSSSNTKIWAQDLNGAYRQFPVRDPDDCFCVLITPGGPVLLRHHALMFGAASSVWNFNRAADAITFLSRRLLATTVGHYVDDFIGIEAADTVCSGFDGFAELSKIMGLRMKEAKALPPQGEQKVLGINMAIHPEGVELAPHPRRCQKVLQTISQALSNNHLSADEAHRLAGKLVFLTSTLFGQLGRAALQPLYARAHGHQPATTGHHLNWPLRSALRTLQGLLHDVQPRFIPRAIKQPAIVIYTDAYFVMDGKHISVGSDQIPSQWSTSKCPNYENGWGYVIHYESQTHFAAGRVPSSLLWKFCTRKAYIYFLEVLAQLIAFLSCTGLPSKLLTSFIDNTAGFFALRKGYCKDQAICNMIALCWRVIAALGWHVHLEWVASGLNVSDQVSRHNFEDMDKLGAIPDRPHEEQIYKILTRVADDPDYTHGPVLDDLLQFSLQHPSTSEEWDSRRISKDSRRDSRHSAESESAMSDVSEMGHVVIQSTALASVCEEESGNHLATVEERSEVSAPSRLVSSADRGTVGRPSLPGLDAFGAPVDCLPIPSPAASGHPFSLDSARTVNSDCVEGILAELKVEDSGNDHP
eukprot:s2457_g3.t1